MQEVLPYFLLAAVATILGVVLWKSSRRLRSTSLELAAVEGEEQRMFHYLHELGSAIEVDSTRHALGRIIVEGVVEVVGAEAGAVYLLSRKGGNLVPRYLSGDCPPLVRVPDEVGEMARKDPRALASFLRLAKAPLHEGILGETLGGGEAVHVTDLLTHRTDSDGSGRSGCVEAMLAPLRHGGRDIGVLAVTRGTIGRSFSGNDFAVFRSAAEQSGFALGNALIYREAEEKRQFESDLRNAGEIQRVLLPQGEMKVPGYRVSGSNLPARIISGDYYDHLQLGDGRHGVVIADVSGKGVGAGLLMAMCRSVLRAQSGETEDPAAALAAVNRQLFPDIREDMFISLFYAVIEGDGGTVRLARAGHDAALFFRKEDSEVQEIKPPGLAIGIDEGEVFERVTKVRELAMNPGDVLLFHTDGIREALDAEGREFGEERLRQAFAELAVLGAEAVVEGIQNAVESFAGEAPQMDDITLFAIEKR